MLNSFLVSILLLGLSRSQMQECEDGSCEEKAPEPEGVTVASEVKTATAQINALNDFVGRRWDYKQKLTLAARILADTGHSFTLSGQLSCRDPNNTYLMWTTPYDKAFELLTPNDFLLMDRSLNVKQGKTFPNRAVRFHGHMYSVRDDVNCIVHSHPPYTSALSIIDQELLIRHMDTMAFYGDVQFIPEWPGIPFGNAEGEMLEEVLGGNDSPNKYWSALLTHHGLIVLGKNVEEVVYRSFFFELGAQMLMRGLMAVGGNEKLIHHVRDDLAKEAKSWRVSDPPVKAHFNNWARIILKKYENRDLQPFFKKKESSVNK